MISNADRTTFSRLQELLSPDENANKYRKALKKTASPMIPFLGVHLGDLVYLTEAKRKELSQNNVNAARMRDSQVHFLTIILIIR
jgi:hypothetical protein